jgi:hypothetical protein
MSTSAKLISRYAAVTTVTNAHKIRRSRREGRTGLRICTYFLDGVGRDSSLAPVFGNVPRASRVRVVRRFAQTRGVESRLIGREGWPFDFRGDAFGSGIDPHVVRGLGIGRVLAANRGATPVRASASRIYLLVGDPDPLCVSESVACRQIPGLL